MPLCVGAQQFAGGDGSENSPFQIATPAQLALLHNYSDGCYSFVLTKNIDLKDFNSSGGGGWEPVGSEKEGPFNGKFNGNGKSISNLTIHRPNMVQVGLFGCMRKNAVVANLTLENVNVVGSEDVGALVGFMAQSCVVENCHVTSGVVQGHLAVGGLVGFMRTGSQVKNSSANLQVHGSADYTGGLVGEMEASSVENSNSKGPVYGATTGTGGLVGFMHRGALVRNCYSSSQVVELPDLVRFRDSRYVGGLVGHAFFNSEIENSYASGAVSGQESVGGLLGFGHRKMVSKGNVALNPSVVGTGDVFALNGYTHDSTTLVQQYTRSDMALREKGTAKYNPSSHEAGININFSATQIPFYQGIGWKFGVSESAPWAFNERSNMPMLWYEGKPATALSLNTNLITLYVGEEYNLLAATVTPSNARLKLVQWYSENSAIASVDSSSGVVTAQQLGFTTIVVRSIDGGYTATCRVSVVPHSQALGVDDNEMMQVKIFPNPVREQLYVEASEDIVSLTVYNSAGALLLEKRDIGGASTSINVAGLPNGVHVVAVRSRSGMRSLKFIVV